MCFTRRFSRVFQLGICLCLYCCSCLFKYRISTKASYDQRIENTYEAIVYSVSAKMEAGCHLDVCSNKIFIGKTLSPRRCKDESTARTFFPMRYLFVLLCDVITRPNGGVDGADPHRAPRVIESHSIYLFFPIQYLHWVDFPADNKLWSFCVLSMAQKYAPRENPYMSMVKCVLVCMWM